MSVFIIDDDIFYTSIIERQLDHLNIGGIQTFNQLGPALEEMQSQKPDMMFLDLHLADQETIPYFKEIKAKLPSIYLVAMSASNEKEILKQCYDAGAFYFLDKNKDLQQNIQQLYKEVNKYKEYFQ